MTAVMVFSISACASQHQSEEQPAETPEPPQELQQTIAQQPDVMEDTAEFLQQIIAEPTVGTLAGEWSVIGLARSGLDVPQEYLDGYYARVCAYVQECRGVLHERKYTEYSRVILALTSIGKDPADVAGYNLLNALADYDRTVFQGVNGAIFALIALDSGDYEIPACQEGSTQASREMYIQYVLEQECPDGGWSLGNGPAQPDLTAMALQALAPYADQPEVKEAVERGVECLSGMQQETGGYLYGDEESSESVAQTILALTALGISPDDPRFVKGEHSLRSRLLDFHCPGGGFSHLLNEEKANLMSSDQAFHALVAMDRFEHGMTSFYDMSDVKALS